MRSGRSAETDCVKARQPHGGGIMKPWYLAAVAGFWSFAPLSAQQGGLVPTAPWTPHPCFRAKPDRSGREHRRLGCRERDAGVLTHQMGTLPQPGDCQSDRTDHHVGYAAYGQPQSAGVVVGTAGAVRDACSPIDGRAGRDRSCWTHLKAWMCYHSSSTELPRCQPTPYITQLQTRSRVRRSGEDAPRAARWVCPRSGDGLRATANLPTMTAPQGAGAVRRDAAARRTGRGH